jgi:CRISPR/Cas system CMR-associated protein Cmr5 small subunit
MYSICRITQSDLDSGLSTCFSNCLNNVDDCSAKSGKIDHLSEEKLRDSIDALILYGHMDLLLEKNYIDLVIEKGYKNHLIEKDWRLKLAFAEINEVRKSSEKIQIEFSSKFERLEVVSRKNSEKADGISNQLSNQQDNLSTMIRTIESLQEAVRNAESSCKAEIENAKSQALMIGEGRQVELENQLKTYSEQFNRSIGNAQEETKKMVEDLIEAQMQFQLIWEKLWKAYQENFLNLNC